MAYANNIKAQLYDDGTVKLLGKNWEGKTIEVSVLKDVPPLIEGFKEMRKGIAKLCQLDGPREESSLVNSLNDE